METQLQKPKQEVSVSEGCIQTALFNFQSILGMLFVRHILATVLFGQKIKPFEISLQGRPGQDNSINNTQK